MDDKELVEVWQREFNSLYNNLASYKESEKGAMWHGFLMAKRSQPIVKIDSLSRYGSTDDILACLTAAGIKYTIGE